MEGYDWSTQQNESAGWCNIEQLHGPNKSQDDILGVKFTVSKILNMY